MIFFFITGKQGINSQWCSGCIYNTTCRWGGKPWKGKKLFIRDYTAFLISSV